MNDPYSVLGITPGADEETIKKAYRQKCKQYHPDLHPDDPTCEDKIKEELAVTSRCMPFEDQEQISDVCVCCGKPAHKLVYWGKAY